MTSQPREEIPLTKLMEAIPSYQASIYVTMLNIIQCIALAFLINEVRITAQSEGVSIPYSLRAAAALVLIFVIWHRYISESQYLWQMSWLDTLIPFLIGIFECMLVFSTSTSLPLHLFVLSFTAIQSLAFVAYLYAYARRIMPTTEKLYSQFYKEYPQFAEFLLVFLREYDWWHINVFAVAVVNSLFVLSVVTLPSQSVEVVLPFKAEKVYMTLETTVPVFYLILLIWGEIANNFQKAIRKYELVGRYFK